MQVQDTRGKVPWRPVGLKSKTANPRPERIGTARDPEYVEETFKPQISNGSIKIM